MREHWPEWLRVAERRWKRQLGRWHYVGVLKRQGVFHDGRVMARPRKQRRM